MGFDPSPWPIYRFETSRRYITKAPDGSLYVEVMHVGHSPLIHPAVVVDTVEEARKVWAS